MIFSRRKIVPIVVLPFLYWNVPNGKRRLLTIPSGPIYVISVSERLDPGGLRTGSIEC